MKYLIVLLLALSLSTTAAPLPSYESHNLTCFVYGTYAKKADYTLALLLKLAGDTTTAKAAHDAGLAEGKVLGLALATPAANYADALVIAANKWYDLSGCYQPLEI